MTTEEDKLPESPEGGAPDASDPSGSSASTGVATSSGEGASIESLDALARINGEPLAKSDEAAEAEEDEYEDVPVQLGSQRFVFAAYFAGGIAVAFLLSKALGYAWARLAIWKPEVGEPHEEIVLPVAALIGALVAFYYYRDEKTRTLAEEVASELGKVTWPSRDEVVNSTFVVILTTLIATTFFALMDRFWGFLTNLVYGA
jgi:preprotein translocase subunit SecE